MKDYFMKLFLDYLNKIKLQILLMLFPTILTGMLFLLYQLPLEPILYIAVLWILTGLGTCAFGFHNYQKNIHNLQIISAAPDINLSRMDAPSNEADALQQEIMHSLNRMRIDAETANQKTLEEMTDYYTMWAHQIKTPIFALRLLLQENPTVNKEALTELFKIEQYVEMVLGYLRTEDMSSDLKLSRCALDSIIREQIHKYAGIFISKKLSLTYEGISKNVLTDEKWLGFVIGQILSNALKYTRTGGIRISLKDVPGNSQNTEDISNMISPSPVTLIIEDTGIGIRKEDLPRIFEKGYTGVNGRENNRATGIGLYLSKKIMKRLGHRIYVTSEEGKGTKVFLEFSQNVLTMY